MVKQMAEPNNSKLILPLNITVSIAMLASILYGIYLATQWKTRNEEWQKRVDSKLLSLEQIATEAGLERFKSTDMEKWCVYLDRELSIWVESYTAYIKAITLEPSKADTLAIPRIQIPPPK
jgi:hypothetical protein